MNHYNSLKGPTVPWGYRQSDKNSYVLPQPIINRGGCNLSLSGLKTDVLRKSKNIKSDQDKFNLAASFQETIDKILRKKTEVAMNEFKKEFQDSVTKSFVVAGGVAANQTIRKSLKESEIKKERCLTG